MLDNRQQSKAWQEQILRGTPRRGWMAQPSPVQALPELAQQFGLHWLGIKRDDAIGWDGGGSKFRKLDTLLATEPFVSSQRWASAGAIGSGHLVACTAAATRLGKTLEANLFWEPLSPGIPDNLAYICGGPTEIEYAGSRLALALQCPQVWLGLAFGDTPSIPPGGTHPAGMAGMVLAGLELAEQVETGLLPEPDRVYIALGSGGNAAGLAVGLMLGGLNTQVHAVAVVERILSPRPRLAWLVGSALGYLARHGLMDPPWECLPRIRIRRGYLGSGYGWPTVEAGQAGALLHEYGLNLEPVYTGKAMACLLEDARRGKSGKSPLFWNTTRGALPPPQEGWRRKLPQALKKRLAKNSDLNRMETPSRRGFLVGIAAATGVAVFARTNAYDSPIEGWHGKNLAHAQARVLVAGIETLAPFFPTPPLAAQKIDRYLTGLPTQLSREIRLMLLLVEQSPFLVSGHLSRFSGLSTKERLEHLEGLQNWGKTGALLYRGLRDLCMMGVYQCESAWPDIGYEGPWLSRSPRRQDPRYMELCASTRAKPKGLLG